MPFRKQQAVFAILSLGIWLFGFPSQWINSWWGFAPLALYFASFSLGILGWGVIGKKLFHSEAASIWLFSSFAAVVMGMLAGHLGLLGATHRWIFMALLIIGIYSAEFRELKPAFLYFKNPWLSALLFFVFALRMFTAYLPQAHGDPLLYHLMGPRLWNQAGAVHLNHDLPIPLLAATWEYFFLWPQVLFTSEPASVAQLALAQVFSQWIHLLWGLYGSVVVLDALLAKKGKRFDELTRSLFIFALIFVGSLHWTAALAKNDCAVAFWCLGSWLFLQDGFAGKRKTYLFWGGIFAGFAVSAKISAILFFIPLALVLGFDWFRKNKARMLQGFSLATLGAVLGVAPVYLRNWIETRDPFYTMFAHWFPSVWISQSWADHFNTHQPSGSFHVLEMLRERSAQFAHETPVMWLWALFPILLFKRETRRQLTPFADWIALFLIAITLMITVVMPDAELRYLGAALWVAAVMGIWFAVVALNEFIPAQRKKVEVLLLIVMVAASKLPTHFLWKFFRSSPGEAYVLKHTGGETKAWLRTHAGDHLVVIVGDNETYYLSTIHTTVLTERPDIDRATYGQKDGALYLKGVCETSHAGLLLDTRATEFGLQLRFPALPWSSAVDFEAGGSRVYNLARLQELVFHGDVGCGHI